MKCGLRPGEIASLRWEHVDFNRLTLSVVDVKKKKPFPVPMDLATADYLRELKGNLEEGWVIKRLPHNLWQDLETHLSYEVLLYLVKKWARLAGCETWRKIRVYDLRHYFAASWAYPADGKRPGNLHALSRILRHGSLFSTQVYLSRLVFEEDIQAEYNRLQTSPFADAQSGNEAPEIGNEFFDRHCRLCLLRPTCRYIEQAMTSEWSNACRFEKTVQEIECKS
jgi:integrase